MSGYETTASLLQATWLTKYASPYKPFCSAVIDAFRRNVPLAVRCGPALQLLSFYDCQYHASGISIPLFFLVFLGCILIYTISSVMHAFWLVLTYDLLEDRSIDDVIIKTFISVYFNSLLYKTNRFQVAVRLFSNRSQRTSKCDISDTLGCASCATFLFLPHFDVIFDLLLNRRTATWNLFVKWIASFTLLVLKKGLTINKLNFALKRAVFCVVGVLWNGGSPCISESDTPVMLPDPLLRLSVISKERKHWPFCCCLYRLSFVFPAEGNWTPYTSNLPQFCSMSKHFP